MSVDEGRAWLKIRIFEVGLALLVAIEHVALSRHHVFQCAEPFATALTIFYEHGKLMLALHHIAVGCLIEVVGQSR